MAEQRAQRSLAAILAADAVGCSPLMGASEASTLASLKTDRRELVDGTIAEHQGWIVKLTGDGMRVQVSLMVEADASPRVATIPSESAPAKQAARQS